MRWIKWIKETNDQVNDWTGSLAKRVKWAELRSFEDARAYSRRQAQTNQLVVWHVFFFGDASQNGCSTQAKQEENNKKSPDVDCVHRPALSDALRSSFSSGHFHFCAQHISTQFECSVSRCRPVSRGQCKNRPIFSDMVTSSVSCNILCKLDANFQWLCRWWPVRLTGCKLATFFFNWQNVRKHKAKWVGAVALPVTGDPCAICRWPPRCWWSCWLWRSCWPLDRPTLGLTRSPARGRTRTA